MRSVNPVSDSVHGNETYHFEGVYRPKDSGLKRLCSLFKGYIRRYRRVVFWGTGFIFVILALTMGPRLVLGDNRLSREAIRWYQALSGQIGKMDGFRLRAVDIRGMRQLDARVLIDALQIRPGASSLSFHVDQARTRLEALQWVHSARVYLAENGIIRLEIEEYIPEYLWKGEGKLFLLDSSGHRIISINEEQRQKEWLYLPLLLGEEADIAVSEAAQILKSAAPLRTQWVALGRVGGRRWDIHLIDHKFIMLPEVNPVGAIQRFISLNERKNILGSSIRHVDLRDPSATIVRLKRNEVLSRENLSALGHHEHLPGGV